MDLILYNSLTRSKERFEPRDPGKVSIYCCGPTVYNRIHVGNARPYAVFSMMKRYLQSQGYQVTLVINLTDIEDKIIAAGVKEGLPALEVARRYAQAYIEDTSALGFERPDYEPRATEHIEAMIGLCKELIRAGRAYATSAGSVYFRVTAFEPYGKLSRRQTKEMRSGLRTASEPDKEDPLDFALWKAAKPGEPSWESPFGPGRPGWHIECSVMSLDLLGEGFDLHGGGNDLLFPHHENEIAQAEAAGHPFARYWLHNGMIRLAKEKMSKSEGDIFLLADALRAVGAPVLLLYFFTTHYRSPIEYSSELLAQARSAYERLQNFYEGLTHAAESSVVLSKETAQRWRHALAHCKDSYHEAMHDDFNSAGALAAVFDLVRELNPLLAQEWPSALEPGHDLAELAGHARRLLKDLLQPFAVNLISGERVPAEIEQLALERDAARLERDFAKADALRTELTRQGWEVRDSPNGPVLKRLMESRS